MSSRGESDMLDMVIWMMQRHGMHTRLQVKYEIRWEMGSSGRTRPRPSEVEAFGAYFTDRTDRGILPLPLSSRFQEARNRSPGTSRDEAEE